MRKKSLAILIMIALVLTLIPQAAMAAGNINAHRPYDLTASYMAIDGLHPYGSALLTLKINNLPGDTGDSTLTWYVGIEKKIGDGEWMGVGLVPSAIFLKENQKTPGVFTYENIWIESYEWQGSSMASYRAYVSIEDLIGDKGDQTGYSNVASLGVVSSEPEAPEVLASKWAVPEIEKAEELGLIPTILKGADLRTPITREEFAELSVLLFEKSLKTDAEAEGINPFNDTENPQILKAYNLKITDGTTPNTFEPKKLINREQCAAMLFRAIKAIAPDADYSIEGVKDFPDQKFISAYAVVATKYMSKIGIIKGDAQGKFMPKATLGLGEVAGYGMATREAAIAMTLRTFELETTK